MKSTNGTPRRRSARHVAVQRRVRAVSRKTKATLEQVAQAAPKLPAREVGAMADNLNAVLQVLRAEYERIKQEIAMHAQAAQDRSTAGNDIGDDASQIAEVSKSLALKRHLERLLVQIEAAMRRIEQGVYGVCERCGQLINPERLEVLPYATMCLGCAKSAPHAA